ncbi:hypothetical protein HAX54_017120 [Datura stramonium]|uniref:Uncharacterized protein n=1 Tax=Datura stramonium TaxID=4076 RepID=A0ABS8UKB6_DATST|nr:hypothetical protein [Datura stramonium]
MAQLQSERVVEECIQEPVAQLEAKDVKKTLASNNKEDSASFKFNVLVPEFVPRSHNTTVVVVAAAATTPISSYLYPYFQYLSGGTTTSDWLYIGDQDTLSYVPNQNFSAMLQKDVLPEDVKNKIIKHVIILILRNPNQSVSKMKKVEKKTMKILTLLKKILEYC